MRVFENQVFNLMDTNGRRNDVANALQGYLDILDNIRNVQRLPWRPLPDSPAQFEFYRQAIERSPEVFKKHDAYDRLMEELEGYPELKAAALEGDVVRFRKQLARCPHLADQFDLGAEDRARHYTSNLVKLGFADDNRNISQAGELLLGRILLRRDPLERLLPLNDMNIVYLRQLMKLRIFSSDGTRYYSPFCMALYALLKRDRISQNEFCELVQGMNPYARMEELDSFIENYREGSIAEGRAKALPAEVCGRGFMGEETFGRIFGNRKSGKTVWVYYEFYRALYRFNESRTEEALDSLLDLYEAEKTKLNKAFGYGRNIFSVSRGNRPPVSDFLEQEEEELFSDSLNRRFYERYAQSKLLDQIREYSDTTMRMFKVTGMISFDNGYAELAFGDLCRCIFDPDRLRKKVFGNIEEEQDASCLSCEEYEEGTDSFFCTVQPLSQILGLDDRELTEIVRRISLKFGGGSVEELSRIVQDKRKKEFRNFVAVHYPEKRVKELLALFSDRSNDRRIKEAVSPDATVPTIFEYIVGLAWYYFSDKTIDLLSSFNLTLSADFEPLTHAGGGMGDIVIREPDKVIMLEATLMNAGSQKRGEWEPVLRHSVNLKIEEEKQSTGREVTTFFIADTFDANTINIWKAISSVPLQSSSDRDQFTDNVIIMPVSSHELSRLMDRKKSYDMTIRRIRELFVNDESSFDMAWRDRFIREVMQ